ncbi:MAG: site-2 protease family protein [Leptospiraceae bacterium]|nr:site-2 protease family protein [Leptospiraceae bacterium]
MLVLILGAVLMLGVCIFIHELGHLLCGMAVGVRARIFSIGYGKGVWKKRIGGTIYQITKFPIGGYVLFAGDQYGRRLKGKEGELLSVPPIKRMFPVLGGPLFNLILGFFLFYILALLGDTPAGNKIFIDPSYAEESPAYRAGLRTGDKILSVNGSKTDSFEDIAASIALSRDTEIKIEYSREGKSSVTTVIPEVFSEDRTPSIDVSAYGERSLVVNFKYSEQFRNWLRKIFDKEYNELQLKTNLPKKKERFTLASSRAIAYLNDGDEILSVEGQKVSTISELQALLGKNQDKTVKVQVNRKKYPLLVPWSKEITTVTVPVHGADILEFSNIVDKNIKDFKIRKFQIVSYDEALDVKLKNLRINGKSFKEFKEMEEYLEELEDSKIVLSLGEDKKNSLEFNANFKLKKIGLLGFRPSMNFEPERMDSRAGFLEAFLFASQRIYSDIKNSLKGIGLMLSGMISASENLAGPVRIVEFAGLSLQDGLFTYLDFVARISIALMITNLLPLPVADGGHLVLYLYEAVTGKPLPPYVIEWIFKIGFLFLLSLMLFVTFNDISRLFR